MLYLTFVKHSKERTVILPAVNFNCLCDLKIINNKTQLSLAFILYQAELYTAFPIVLLCKDKNNINNINIYKFHRISLYNMSFNA